MWIRHCVLEGDGPHNRNVILTNTAVATCFFLCYWETAAHMLVSARTKSHVQAKSECRISESETNSNIKCQNVRNEPVENTMF